MNEEDLEFLNEVRNECAPEFLHDPRTFTLDETKEWFKETQPEFYIIMLKSERIGYFRVAFSFPDEFESSDAETQIWVGADLHKDYRGKGYAYDAYRSFLPTLCNINKVDKLYLEVLETNVRAHNLYLKLGFEEISRKPFRDTNSIRMIWTKIKS